MAPETMLAAPCPTSSRSRSLRVRVCMRSTATAVSRLSTLAIRAIVRTPAAKAPQAPSGRLGSDRASISEPLSSMRVTSRARTIDSTVAVTIAISGPGTTRSGAGAQRQPTMIAMTRAPSAIPAGFASAMCTGRWAMLCHTELCDSPPSRTWTCCSAIVMPIPASIACTTIGETASATRPSLVRPKTICSTPAQTVIAQVTAHPNSATKPATMTVSPAAGPLTCRGEPPSAPATTPPTIAAITPASTGASEATAIPSDRGRATRNTTSEAGRSYRRTLVTGPSFVSACAVIPARVGTPRAGAKQPSATHSESISTSCRPRWNGQTDRQPGDETMTSRWTAGLCTDSSPPQRFSRIDMHSHSGSDHRHFSVGGSGPWVRRALQASPANTAAAEISAKLCNSYVLHDNPLRNRHN